jgi:Fe-S cluster assembly iron-binding protein IscA
MLENLQVSEEAAQAIKDFLSRRKGPQAVRIFLSAG